MVDLSVNFAGLELKNPLVVASGPISHDIRQVKKAEECGASAVIFKAILPPGIVTKGTKIRWYIDRKAGALSGLVGGKQLTYEEGVNLVKAAKKDTKVKIGVNIPFFEFEDRELYADTAKGLADAGADFVEMNFSSQSPAHLGLLEKLEESEVKWEKVSKSTEDCVRDLPTWALEGIKVVKQAVNVPVIGKISPEGLDVVTMAMAMERGGADAIDAINGLSGSPPIDIFNGGRLKVPATRSCTYSYCGAPIKPIAQAIVGRISKAVKIPILGTGGLMNWRDVVEMIMFGATAVSFCTLLMIHGFEAITGIEKGLRESMGQQGYSHINDFRGLALKYVAESRPACEVIDSVARIDIEKCIGCDICLKPAHCLAITMKEGKAAVDEKECLGCGTCFLFCPANAITMIQI